MTAVKVDLDDVEQGATYVLSFQWCNEGVDPDTPGPPRDLTGCIGRMQVRLKRGSPVLIDCLSIEADPKIIFGVDPDGSPTPDLTNGWITVTLPASDTDLLVKATAKYDLEVLMSDAVTVHRLIEGSMKIDANITQDVP